MMDFSCAKSCDFIMIFLGGLHGFLKSWDTRVPHPNLDHEKMRVETHGDLGFWKIQTLGSDHDSLYYSNQGDSNSMS